MIWWLEFRRVLFRSTNNWFTNLLNKIRMYSILLMCRFLLIHSDRYSNFDDKWIWLSDDKWIGQNLWTFMLKDAWISNKSLWHTNAVFNIQHPWTTHSIQISIQISMWNNSWTSNRWQRKIVIALIEIQVDYLLTIKPVNPSVIICSLSVML